MKRTTIIPKPEEIAEICSRKSTQSREDAINSILIQNGLPKLKPTTEMTPSQLEHLKLIDAHLERLLSIAAKRTPEKWVAGATIIGNGVDTTVCEMPSREKDSLAWHDNIHFIASCAGNAEAGWRSTRAAIAIIVSLSTHDEDATKELIESILAAFPLELIQKP